MFSRTRVNKTLLMSTHNICFYGAIRKHQYLLVKSVLFGDMAHFLLVEHVFHKEYRAQSFKASLA